MWVVFVDFALIRQNFLDMQFYTVLRFYTFAPRKVQLHLLRDANPLLNVGAQYFPSSIVWVAEEWDDRGIRSAIKLY